MICFSEITHRGIDGLKPFVVLIKKRGIKALDAIELKCFFRFQNVNAIEVSVPVGNTDHTTLVVGLTTFIVSGATVYLMVTIFCTMDKKKTD